MWRKLISLALGLEILTAMLLFTATPGVASESRAPVSELSIPLRVPSGFGETKVPPEITVNSGEQMQLASRKGLALEPIPYRPLKNPANNSATFDTFHPGFDNPSDTFWDLPVPEDPLSEAYLHSHSPGVTFPLKAASGLAGLIGQGNGFVQKTIFYDTLLCLPGCSLTETYLAWTVTAGASTIVANPLLSDCDSHNAFLSPTFLQITPVNKALGAFDPLAKQTDKPQQSGLTDLTLILAAIPACLPRTRWLNLDVAPAYGRHGTYSIPQVNRKDLII
jgi:hypothetical protein